MTPDPRLINYNKHLYGPGPVYRRPTKGFGAMTPLRGFTMMIVQGLGLGFAAAAYYKIFIARPYMRTIEEYHKEHPEGY
jgi:hypothetical protein